MVQICLLMLFQLCLIVCDKVTTNVFNTIYMHIFVTTLSVNGADVLVNIVDLVVFGRMNSPSDPSS